MKRLATEDLTFLRICKEDLGNAQIIELDRNA